MFIFIFCDAEHLYLNLQPTEHPSCQTPLEKKKGLACPSETRWKMKLLLKVCLSFNFFIVLTQFHKVYVDLFSLLTQKSDTVWRV